jgi:hypothetical protein
MLFKGAYPSATAEGGNDIMILSQHPVSGLIGQVENRWAVVMCFGKQHNVSIQMQKCRKCLRILRLRELPISLTSSNFINLLRMVVCCELFILILNRRHPWWLSGHNIRTNLLSSMPPHLTLQYIRR